MGKQLIIFTGKQLMILFTVLLAVFMAIGCTAPDTGVVEEENVTVEESAQAVRDTDLRVTGIEVNEASSDVVDVTFTMRVYNPSDTTVELERMEYEVFANDVRLGSGSFEEPLEIPSNQQIETSTNFVAQVSTVPPAIINAISEGEVTWNLEGTMFFDTPSGTVEQPFSRELEREEGQ